MKKPDWWREEIHGRKALLARQAARSAFKLNAPNRGPRGLKNIYQSAAVQKKLLT